MGVSSTIRTSASLVVFAVSVASCLACAKGTEISEQDVVLLPLLPEPGADAGADAGAPPGAAASSEAAPVTTETDP